VAAKPREAAVNLSLMKGQKEVSGCRNASARHSRTQRLVRCARRPVDGQWQRDTWAIAICYSGGGCSDRQRSTSVLASGHGLGNLRPGGRRRHRAGIVASHSRPGRTRASR